MTMHMNKEVVSLSKEEVKKVAHLNPTAEGMFLDWNERRRFRKYTNVELHFKTLDKKGVKYDKKEYFDTLKKLSELGVGTLRYGRKGNPDVFIWNYSLKDIAKIGIENKDIEPIKLEEERKVRKRMFSKSIDIKNVDNGAYIEIKIPREFLSQFKIDAA